MRIAKEETLAKKAVIIGTVTVLAVAGLGFFGLRRLRQSAAAAGDLQTIQARRGSVVATISTAGTVQTVESLDLAFQASGQVIEVKVKEGDAVRAGQEIACLDATDAQLQVSQAEISLDNARAALEEAQKGASAEEIAAAEAALASAQENLKALQAGPSASDIEAARLEVDRAKNSLWSAQCSRDATCGNPMASGSACDQANAAVANAEIAVQLAQMNYEKAQEGPSEKDLRAAEAQVAQAKLNLAKLTDSSSTSVRTAQNQVKQAELSLQQAQRSLAQCCLKAPADGVVTGLSLQVGQSVAPNTTIATLAGNSGLEVVADMVEADVARVEVGQEAEILLDAMPGRPLRGRVVDIARTGTSTQGVVTFPITLSLEEADPAVKPGMTANVTIVVDRRDDVLVAPSRAVQVRGQQHLVRILREGEVVELPVQIGLSGDNGIELLGDTVRDGDLLVVNSSGAASSPAGMPRMPGGGVFIAR